jgi:hypothetical protein
MTAITTSSCIAMDTSPAVTAIILQASQKAQRLPAQWTIQKGSS